MNEFLKSVDVMFEQVAIEFEMLNVASRNVSHYHMGSGPLQQSGGTVHLPMPFQTSTVDGRDVSSAWRSLNQLSVPCTLNGDTHLVNVPIAFEGVDLNRPNAINDVARAAARRLSAAVDVKVASKIATYGSQAVVISGNLSGYDDLAIAEEIMLAEGQHGGDAKMLLCPSHARKTAGNLAGRETMTGAPMDAYERTRIPNVAGFDAFKTDYGKSIAGSAGTGYLVNGANQGHIPRAMQAANPDMPHDNRTSTLTVDTGTGAAVGDIFTIAGVYGVHATNKEDTARLKTFRVVAIDGNDWTVSPAIIPKGTANEAQQDYANCSAAPADNAAITILNTTTAPSSVFYDRDAVKLMHSEYVLDMLQGSNIIRSYTTETGLHIALVMSGDGANLTGKMRLFTWCNPEILNYERAGVIIDGQ